MVGSRPNSIAGAFDELVDISIRKILASFEQHLSQLLFAVRAAGMTDVAQWADAVDQHRAGRIEDGVEGNSASLTAIQTLSDIVAVLVADVVDLEHHVVFFEQRALVVEPAGHVGSKVRNTAG